MSKKVWDTVTQNKISTLHPELRPVATQLVNNLEKKHGINARIYTGIRSWEEQNQLYAKGRTEPGPIVTNAKGGESYHNYGLAFDIVEIKDGKALWTNPNWETIGREGEALGLTWGGRWAFQDKPHFQKTFGYTTGQLATLDRVGSYPIVT